MSYASSTRESNLFFFVSIHIVRYRYIYIYITNYRYNNIKNGIEFKTSKRSNKLKLTNGDFFTLKEHISENVERLKNLSSSQKQQMSRVCIKKLCQHQQVVRNSPVLTLFIYKKIWIF